MSFRFHIVSIIAVFLALALGIGMGVTVINEATVDLLRTQLDGVRSEVNAANQRSDALERQVGRSNEYETAAARYLVADRLAGVPVTLIAARGIDTTALSEVRTVVSQAGAALQGTLWITDAMNLSEQRDINQLRQLFGLPDADPGTLKQAFVTRVSGALAGVSNGSTLQPLVETGFLEWDGDGASDDIAEVQFGASRLLVASSPVAATRNDEVLVPVLRLMAATPAPRVVAVEPGREADGRAPGERAVFLQPIRADGALNGRISTVDNIEMPSGRVATVLALSQLPAGRVGHYGVAGSAQGQIPEATG